MRVCGTHAFCSHADTRSYLLAWQYDLFQPYQVTPSPQLHQREGSHSMDAVPAVDSLCVLSLFHTAGFIGKLAGSAPDEVMVKNGLSLMRNLVILHGLD